MFETGIAAIALLLTVQPAFAEERSLECLGSEPTWNLALEKPDVARLALPEGPPVEYRGAATQVPAFSDRVWRGRPGAGSGGDLVVFLRDADCSDPISDVTHPVMARVSLADGRLLAGCCRITTPGSSSSASAGAAAGMGDATVEGRVWRLASLPGQDAASLAAVPGGVTVEFTGGNLEALAGCNRMRGSYTLEHGHVELGPLAGTMMACPEPLMAVEDAVKRTLTGRLRYAVGGDRLTLTSSDGRALVFDAVPPPALAGSSWEVTGFNNGRDAVVGPLLGTTLTLSFVDDTVVGHAGCNTFRASYTHDGDRLSVGPAATTRKACVGEGVMQQEREFLAAIESATKWTIAQDLLDVHRADGHRVLAAKRIEPTPATSR